MEKNNLFEGSPYTKKQFIVMLIIALFVLFGLTAFYSIVISTLLESNQFIFAIIFAFGFVAVSIVLAFDRRLGRILEWIFSKFGIKPYTKG